MKRILLALLLALTGAAAHAYDFVVGGIYYNILSDGESVEVTSGSSDKYSGAITIPSSVTYSGKTYSVTSIGSDAFYGCSGLTSVTIPNSVTTIGSGAFWGCTGLTSVTIPNSVTSIRGWAFYGCSGLTSVTIPISVTSIGSGAFSGCSGMTSVTIPNSVTSIGDRVFYGCSSLTAVTIPNSVTAIGYGAFDGCSGLTAVTIPNSVMEIGGRAFDGCSSLTGTLTIPSAVTSIGSDAFSGCSGLESIVVENGNSIYDSRGNCNAIIETATNTLISGCMNTVIPNSVTSIGGYAFKGCSGLMPVIIPNSVTKIGEWAFFDCSGLTSVTIPNSVTSIGEYAFSGCSGLTSVVFNAENCSTMGSLYFPVFEGCKSISSLTIGEGVKTIPAFAFKHLRGLTSVTIPNSVTSIGPYAFSECSGLTSVVFNAENCSTMGSSSSPVFSGCTRISSLTIGEGVKTIPNYAFYNCSGLTSVTIPNSVTSIGESAFSVCSGLTSVVFNAENSVRMGSSSKPVFNGCTHLTSLTIGEGVKTIPNYAFYNCSGLTGALTIPNSVTSIGVNAFNGAAQVTEILLGESVANIGASAFAGMVRVAKVTSLNPTPPECAAPSVFQDITKDKCKLYVPAGKKTTYAETYVWWDFTNIIELQSIDVESITLDAESLTMPIGSSTTITYTIAPDNATTTALEWSVSNPAVASIVDHNDGTATVKALSIGEATITAKATDGSNVTATCAVKVEPIWVSSLTLSAESVELKIGESTSLSCTVSPDNATTKTIEWEVDNPDIVSLTDNGNGTITVNTLAVGEATITAKATDGSNVTATCAVKVEPIWVSSLTLSAESVELKIGESTSLSCTVSPDNATTKTIEWEVDNPDIVSLTDNGNGTVTVNTLAVGEATITVKATDGSNVTATCAVKVEPIWVSSLTLSAEQLEMNVGDSEVITYTILPANATNKSVAWSSSDPAVASVTTNADGSVTINALAIGEATITARTLDGSGIAASCVVTVNPIFVSQLTLSAEQLEMNVGDSEVITYTILPEDAADKSVAWSSNDSAVASITTNADGSVTVNALAIGEATITARTLDGSNLAASCVVTVNPIFVSQLTLSAEQLEMNVGDSEVISYVALPDEADDKSVSWASSDPAVASITTNADGSVTVNALAIGEATITARTLDGSNLAASCVVKVTPTLVKTLTLSAEQLEMNVGDSEVITYTILPEDAADKSVAWSSNNSAVASITTNADGSVTVNALAIGEATITARTIDGSNLAASCVVKVGSAGVGDFDAADIEIIASAEGIVVKGAPADCIIDVYTAAGVLVYHGYDSLIPIRNHGIYFVFVAGVKAKVVL